MESNIYNQDYINIDGNWIHKTAVIYPNVKLGIGNRIGAYCVIGSDGEIRNTKPQDFKGKVVIGNNNIISELVSIQRPLNEFYETKIGDGCIIMAHCHIGHDAIIGNDVELCTGTIVGGYATVCYGAKIKLGCTLRNRITIGSYSVVGMGSIVTKDVQDNEVVYGNPAKQNIK